MDAGENNSMIDIFLNYAETLKEQLSETNWEPAVELGSDLRRAWVEGRHVFICGNGGSAANAMHIANDLIYGANPEDGGLRVEALSANSAVITCLANDVGYDEIFAHQLKVKASDGDLLICLSGSGNSPNIVRAIETAKSLNVKTYSVLGYSGGLAKELSDCAIHFPVDDMQVAEDLQLVVGHMLMKYLSRSQLKGLKASSPDF